MEYNFEEIVEHLKQYGFFFQNSEIYGGIANSWDYGPLGISVKQKIKHQWWKFFVNDLDFNYGLDSNILMNPKVWVASGHASNFSDPLIDCKECKYRFRADKIIEKVIGKDLSNVKPEVLEELLEKHQIKCPKCNKHNFTNIRDFKLMFEVNNSIISKDDNLYLRPETAQGIFINFKNIQRTMAAKLPFGVGQIGKSFRNEITPGNFIFRTREFEQMELEFFYSKYDQTDWFEFWLNKINDFLIKEIKLNKNKIIKNEHTKDKLAHYSSRTVDLNYKFPFGIEELWGISNRSDFDLSVHQKHSGTDLTYFDQDKKERYLPFVIEPSVGVDRLLLALICNAFTKETLENNKSRTYLKINPKLAPITIDVLPLVKKPELLVPANKIAKTLRTYFDVRVSETGSIGKRYFRADAIGIPFCLTYDYDSLNDQAVTIRYRDTMKQERIKISELTTFFFKKLM